MPNAHGYSCILPISRCIPSLLCHGRVLEHRVDRLFRYPIQSRMCVLMILTENLALTESDKQVCPIKRAYVRFLIRSFVLIQKQTRQPLKSNESPRYTSTQQLSPVRPTRWLLVCVVMRLQAIQEALCTWDRAMENCQNAININLARA